MLTLSDRVTVLRRGRVVGKTRTADTDADALAVMMVGENSEAAAMLTRTGAVPQTAPAPEDAPRLSVSRLDFAAKDRASLHDVSFDVAAGEIFGIAGVDGNGQSELADCLAGLAKPRSGTLSVNGVPLPANPLAAQNAGIAVIPADRQARGLALPMTLAENFALGVWRDKSFRVGAAMKWPEIWKRADKLIRRFDIRADGAGVTARSLSGGNQQKVVIARALADHAKVVVAVNPTRGLDVGAIAYVHDALRIAQAEGAAIVLISTELEEVRTLSHRVGVLFEGRIVDILPADAPRELFGLRMGGRVGTNGSGT